MTSPPIRSAPIHCNPVSHRQQPIIIFVTVCIQKTGALLTNQHCANALVETWRSMNDWAVGNFVIMPDHLHLLCSPARNCRFSLERWTYAWRSVASRKLFHTSYKIKWHRDFWDTQIRNSNHLTERLIYIANNPVARGLCHSPEAWPWSGQLFEIPSPKDF